MASEIKVDTIVNAGGDNDSGIDLSTNDNIKFNIAGSQKAIIESNGRLGIGTSSPSRTLHVNSGSTNTGAEFQSTDATSSIKFTDDTGTAEIGNTGDALVFFPAGAEKLRLTSSGELFLNKTSTSFGTAGIELFPNGAGIFTASADTPMFINRTGDDGTLIRFFQDGTLEGHISVSGSTISLTGFSGQHETSGIPTNTPMGTVVSTIDELDVYPLKQGDKGEEEDNPKAGQTRADHPKVKISDTVGDSAVYGVVGSFTAQDKVMVTSVGTGSVRVTGACAKGDLLESNGDGTAKVQSDDIVRSKTIGKVTIGNSSTDVKLVSCVLYCG